ncbi:MAG: hypothetical protein GY856_28145 [bacterium]|nr:hypothetical protein [bacterium]
MAGQRTATQTIPVLLPPEVVRDIDRHDENRSHFILQAVRSEVERRRREERRPTHNRGSEGCGTAGFEIVELKMVNLRRAVERAKSIDVPPNVALRIILSYDDDLSEDMIDEIGVEAPPDRPDEIDQLYGELKDLNARIAQEPALEDEITEKLNRLRRLQAAEALEMRNRFQAQLPLRPGAGWKALEEAERLLGDDHTAT